MTWRVVKVSDTLLPALLKPEEFGEQIRAGRTTVYALMREGAVASVKVGRLRRIPSTEVARYVESLELGGTGDE